MRCVLEIRRGLGDDSKKEEVVVNEKDSNEAFEKAWRSVGWEDKVTLWREFDNMDEAQSDEGNCYYLGGKDGRKVLRRCMAATGL